MVQWLHRVEMENLLIYQRYFRLPTNLLHHVRVYLLRSLIKMEMISLCLDLKDKCMGLLMLSSQNSGQQKLMEKVNRQKLILLARGQ